LRRATREGADSGAPGDERENREMGNRIVPATRNLAAISSGGIVSTPSGRIDIIR